MAGAIMFQGTGSDVGKSVLVAGLCRVALRRGIRVMPFKPQNMSNNAAVSDDGGEIGRAQWLQALACGVPSSVHMNPVLLKPHSDMGSQLIVQGMVRGEARGEYYQQLKQQLLDAVMDSFARISSQADLVLVEGAGSPAEINLRSGDIANMGFALCANVPVVMIGDIDRGGVIASLVGTHTVLSDKDRAQVQGFIINKFRGNISLFDDGLEAIRSYTNWRSFGVVPWVKAVARLPAEDAVVLERGSETGESLFKIAVPMLPRIANFDDLDPLKAEPGVQVIMVPPGSAIPDDAKLIILPGTKSTIADLSALRDNGWAQDISAHLNRGGHIFGICGGYQMLGQTISDPDAVEGPPVLVNGLGLLDVDTVMKSTKQVRNVKGHCVMNQSSLEGYEIHVGRSESRHKSRPFAVLNGRVDGAVSADGRVMGTYLHGVFNSDEFRQRYLAELGAKVQNGLNFRESIEAALDELAQELEAALDIDQLFALAR